MKEKSAELMEMRHIACFTKSVIEHRANGSSNESNGVEPFEVILGWLGDEASASNFVAPIAAGDDLKEEPARGRSDVERRASSRRDGGDQERRWRREENQNDHKLGVGMTNATEIAGDDSATTSQINDTGTAPENSVMDEEKIKRNGRDNDDPEMADSDGALHEDLAQKINSRRNVSWANHHSELPPPLWEVRGSNLTRCNVRYRVLLPPRALRTTRLGCMRYPLWSALRA
ncbi:hypothetical protein LXL04_007438 [Taraxacum kok-saghyz]